MKWQEVRELYPDKFILFKIFESHVIGNKEYVDDVPLIKAISDGKEAMKEFTDCKLGQLVYSTRNEEIIIQLFENIGIKEEYIVEYNLKKDSYRKGR